MPDEEYSNLSPEVKAKLDEIADKIMQAVDSVKSFDLNEVTPLQAKKFKESIRVLQAERHKWSQ
tara:strand:- start:311 stop:502 length:192 start_codon:yes stop_codon:yes gene_type:complete